MQRGHPRGQQAVCDLRAISVTPPGNGAPRRSVAVWPGMEPHATAEYLPPPRATPASLLYQRCVGMAVARPRVGSPAKWARETLEGLERWDHTLLVSKHHLPFNLLSLALD